MLNIFKNIKAVGFDIDRTLYKENPLIAQEIKKNLIQKVLEKKPELKSIREAEILFDRIYDTIGSSTQTLKIIGFTEAEKVMYECLSKADVTKYLTFDKKLCKIFNKLLKKYSLFLISTKPSDLAEKVLIKLGISPEYFSFAIYGDNPVAHTKTDGSMFRYLLSLTKMDPKKHVYIGDNLKADIIPAKNLGFLTIAVGDTHEATTKINEIYRIEELLL